MEELIVMDSRVKKKIIYFIQICIGLAILIVIMMQVNQMQFLAYFTNLSLMILLIIFSLTGIGLYIQFRRWKYLVEKYSVNFRSVDLLPSFLAGFTLRLLIPGGHAEFSKIFLLPGKKRGKILAFGMEKFAQTLIKILALLIVLPFSFPRYRIFYILIFVLLVLVYILFPKIPILKNLQEKDVNYHRVFGMNFIFAMGIFFIMGLQYYILLNLVDSVSLLATYHTSVYLWAAGLVPISISGLGVREGLAMYFFNIYHVSAADAVATSLFLFTLNTIIPALVGIYALYKNNTYLGEFKESIKSTRGIITALRANKKRS